MTAWEMLPIVLALLNPTHAPQRPEYRVHRTAAAAEALLAGDERAWSRAAAIGWGEDPYRTRFRALRDEGGLWARWDCGDDRPWHTLTERDDPIWNEEVVEIFLDPDGDGRDYAELEISPAGVVTDLLVREATPRLRTEIDWDIAGLRTRVTERAGEHWSAVAFLPWAGLASVRGAEAPPAAGDAWRFNVFRIKRPHGPEEPERDVILAAWSPVPGAGFHVPEVFGWMRFED